MYICWNNCCRLIEGFNTFSPTFYTLQFKSSCLMWQQESPLQFFSQSLLMSSVKLHIFLHVIPNQFKNLFLRVWIGFLSTLFITNYALNLIQSFLNTAARVLFCKGKSNSVTLSIHAQPLLHIKIMRNIKKIPSAQALPCTS